MNAFLIAFLFVALLLLNAVLAACQFSLVKLRYLLLHEGSLDQLRAEPKIARLLDHTDYVARIIRMGGSFCAVCLGLTLYAYLERLAEGLGFEQIHLPVLIAALLVTLAVHYLVCDLLPRAASVGEPHQTLRQTASVVNLFAVFMAPVEWFSRRFDTWLLRKLNLDPSDTLNYLDLEVQTRALGEEDLELSPQLRQIMRNVLRMSDLDLSDILLPRNQVQFFDLDDSLEENLDRARRTGHTRFPLCEGDLDHCIGIIHIKDVFRYPGDPRRIDPRRIKRNIIRMPDSMQVEDALQKLLSLKMHMALVVDEFGGTIGVISLERILEELVGDIQDEFDSEEMLICSGDDGWFAVSGLAPLHDVQEAMGIEIDREDVSTFGGLITAELGRIPSGNEKILLEEPPLQISIEEVDEKRVISTRAKVVAKAPDSSDH